VIVCFVDIDGIVIKLSFYMINKKKIFSLRSLKNMKKKLFSLTIA